MVSGSATKNYRLTNFERECSLFFSEIVQIFGVPKSVGQIYGLLYASSEPMSFSDIFERLDISKGSASQGLQLLRSLGAINVMDAQQHTVNDKYGVSLIDAPRRDYYMPELSLRKLISGILQERVAPLATAGKNGLGRLRELAEQNRNGSDFYLDRVKQLEIWQRRLKTALPMLTMLLGPKAKK